MTAYDRILVVAAHPDDEALGCGGMIARHTMEGAAVSVLFLADGETARGADKASGIALRQEASRAACHVLGVTDVRFLTFPDNRMDTVPLINIVQAIESVSDDIGPALIYTHHAGDVNIDHQITHRAVLTACRPIAGRSVRCIRSFEVLSSTEWATPSFSPAFRPTLFCDIASQMDAKLAALHCYAAEMREYPHSRSREAVVALARYRGVMAGLTAAEAFMIEREIQ